MAERFRILDHPADLGIEARGETPGSTFEHAAEGLMSVILDPDSIREIDSRTIGIEAADIEQLAVRWLSEVLYLYDGRGFACKTFTVTDMTPVSLQATVRGEMLDPERHRTRLDVKAITYHQLLFREGRDGFVLRVYIDI